MNFYTLNHNTINLIASFLRPNCAVNLKKSCKFANEKVSLFHHNILYNISWDIVLEKPRSEKFLEKCIEYVDWNAVCSYQKLSPSFILKHFDKLCLERIGEYQDVDENFIDRLMRVKGEDDIYKRRITRCIHYILKHNSLEQKIIDKLTDYLYEVYKIAKCSYKFFNYLNILAKYQKLSLEFIKKHNNNHWWENLSKYQDLNYADTNSMLPTANLMRPMMYKNIYKTKQEILENVSFHIAQLNWNQIRDFDQYLYLENEIKNIYDEKISQLKSEIIPAITACEKCEKYNSIESVMEKMGKNITFFHTQKKLFEINIELTKNPNMELKETDLSYVIWDVLSSHPKLSDEKIIEYKNHINFEKLLKHRDFSQITNCINIDITWKICWKTYLKQSNKDWAKYLSPRSLIKHKPWSNEKIAQFLLSEGYFRTNFGNTIVFSNMSTSLILEIVKLLKGNKLRKFLHFVLTKQNLPEQFILKLLTMYRQEIKEVMATVDICKYQQITRERLEELILNLKFNGSHPLTACKLYYQKVLRNTKKSYPDASPLQILKITDRSWKNMTKKEKEKYKEKIKEINKH